MNLNALILAGGQSTRMGTSKSQLEYGGMPQYLRLAEMFRNMGLETYLSCKNADRKNYGDLRIIADLPDYENRGPASGVISALSAFPEYAWFIVACDYPLIQEDDLNDLLFQRNESNIGTFYKNQDHIPEPLIGIYEQAAGWRLKEWLNLGNSSLRRFLEVHHANFIKPQFPDRLISVDTPDKYAAICNMISPRNH